LRKWKIETSCISV